MCEMFINNYRFISNFLFFITERIICAEFIKVCHIYNDLKVRIW